MRAPHHPRIMAVDRGWVIECRECQLEARGGQLPPVGIGMLLESKETAERLRHNHAGPSILPHAGSYWGQPAR
jgi:hypothetical protein